MITKEAFLTLYEKFKAGQCTPEEIDLLENYRDEMHLLEDDWVDDQEKQDVKSRIWQRLEQSRQAPVKKLRNSLWFKVAAIVFVVLSAGIAFINYHRDSTPVAIAKNSKALQHNAIKPGSNKAYLTIAGGKTIILSDAHNGHLATQAGISVNKAKDGLLTYHAAEAANNENSSLGDLNTITTPRGGQYQLVLTDGTKVWLNAASSLKYPVAFNGASRTVDLTGEAYFEVAKNKAKPFIVKANGSSIEVLGTHFDVSAYSDDKTVTTTLLEGSVRLSKGSASRMLIPGQKGVSVNGKDAISVQQADIDQAIAWKNGLFLFKNADIYTIMKQASRWYDVDITYSGNLKNQEYGGKLSRYNNISELLQNLELTGNVHFQIEGRRITVMQ
ncbi:MAG TPA: FecR domain-containing protein [Mucilaginibacter sp.]|nr:FecR domain-containing protein [Mucilaginibacter sp.]